MLCFTHLAVLVEHAFIDVCMAKLGSNATSMQNLACLSLHVTAAGV